MLLRFPCLPPPLLRRTRNATRRDRHLLGDSVASRIERNSAITNPKEFNSSFWASGHTAKFLLFVSKSRTALGADMCFDVDFLSEISRIEHRITYKASVLPKELL